eukprot:g6476.t1
MPFCRQMLRLSSSQLSRTLPFGQPFSPAMHFATSGTNAAAGPSQLGMFLPRDDPSAGRAWRISELRLKSQEDLHNLWYVLWIERNMLKTEYAYAKAKGNMMRNPARIKKVRNSMARLKTVLGERGREVKAFKAAKRKEQNDINRKLRLAASKARYVEKRHQKFAKAQKTE